MGLSIDGNCKDVFIFFKRPNWAEFPQKSILPMSQKSRRRKWVNSVGRLNTRTENPDFENEQAQRWAAGDHSGRKYTEKYDPRPYGFGWGGGDWGLFWIFVHYSKLHLMSNTALKRCHEITPRWSKSKV